MLVHAARALLEDILRKLSLLLCKSMEGGGRTMSLLGFVMKSMYPERDGSKLSSGYTMVLPHRVLLRLL